MKNKSYNQFCGLALALDVIGERWTILIVRELFAGPRRFTDLMEGLPGISTNLLSERLKSLEEQGLLRRRVLPPPAASSVYELTDMGRGLEGTLIELGKWGSQFVPSAPKEAVILNLGSYALTLKTLFDQDQAQGINETYELRIGNEVLQVKVNGTQLDVRQGETYRPDVVFYTDMPTYLGLLAGNVNPADALAKGLLRVEGDAHALERFLSIFHIALPA